MANIQKVDKIESKFNFIGEFCEIKLFFLDKVSTAPVIVEQPEMKFERKVNDKYELFTVDVLVPLSPSSAKFGEYRTTFFSDTLEPDIYKITFSGYYPDKSKQDNLIEIHNEFQIFTMNEFQGILDSLRIQLNDNKPDLYWIDDTDKFRWDDGELFNAIKWSMEKWNATPPASSGNDVINKNNLLRFPLINVIFEGAEFYALNQKYNLETFNQLQYTDELGITINRAPGIMSKMQLLKQIWLDNLTKIKKDYALRHSSQARGIKSTRIPARALRQLSFVPSLSFLSNGGY